MLKKYWQLLACCVVTMLVTMAGIFIGISFILEDMTGSSLEPLRFLRALHILQKKFDGEVDTRALFDGAIRGMTDAAGDPYTVYLDAQDNRRMNDMANGTFGGIGIVLGKRGDDYVVIAAIPENPGALAGIKSGDKIISVDGIATSTLNMEQVVTKIRGEEGTEVELELASGEEEKRRVRVVRKEIKQQSVGSAFIPGTKIGYIRIVVFSDTTADDFAKEYKKLEQGGMEALLLDLRGNPGGILDASVGVARFLVPKGPIVSVIHRDGDKYTESSYLEELKYPLAVLVDNGSASASEIVAGAIKDTKAGKLFGEKTFGKGSVQSVYRLDGETSLKVTTASYYTPSGVSINKVGIEPDVVVPLPEDATKDVQLEAAVEYLKSVHKQ